MAPLPRRVHETAHVWIRRLPAGILRAYSVVSGIHIGILEEPLRIQSVVAGVGLAYAVLRAERNAVEAADIFGALPRQCRMHRYRTHVAIEDAVHVRVEILSSGGERHAGAFVPGGHHEEPEVHVQRNRNPPSRRLDLILSVPQHRRALEFVRGDDPQHLDSVAQRHDAAAYGLRSADILHALHRQLDLTVPPVRRAVPVLQSNVKRPRRRHREQHACQQQTFHHRFIHLSSLLDSPVAVRPQWVSDAPS